MQIFRFYQTILGHPIRQTSCVALSLADNVCSNIIQRAQLKTSCRKTLTYILKLCVFVYAITCVRFSHYAIVFSCTRILLYHITSTAANCSLRAYIRVCARTNYLSSIQNATHTQRRKHTLPMLYMPNRQTQQTRATDQQKKTLAHQCFNHQHCSLRDGNATHCAARNPRTTHRLGSAALGTRHSGEW